MKEFYKSLISLRKNNDCDTRSKSNAPVCTLPLAGLYNADEKFQSSTLRKKMAFGLLQCQSDVSKGC